MIWYEQYIFFRRYGLQNDWVVFLNGALIFVVLFYVYPLKFLFTVLTYEVLGIPVAGMLRPDQLPVLMRIFSAGYVAVFGIFVLLYLHAWRQRDALDLNEIERFDTRHSIITAALNGGIGLLSLAIATVSPENAGLSGAIYFLNAPMHTIRGMVAGRQRKRIEKRLARHSETPVAG
jgi:hypothetical protein